MTEDEIKLMPEGMVTVQPAKTQQISDCCELLVCPFCGGEPELDTLRYYKPIVGESVHKSVSIYCTGDSGCPVEMMFCYADFPDFTVEQLTELAKEFWNKRAH